MFFHIFNMAVQRPKSWEGDGETQSPGSALYFWLNSEGSIKNGVNDLEKSWPLLL